IADENNHRLRRIAPEGTIATVAGSGQQGFAADGSVAISSAQNQPIGAAVSAFGWPVIADETSGTVRILFSDGKLYSPDGLSTRTTTLTATAPNAIYGTAQSSVT